MPNPRLPLLFPATLLIRHPLQVGITRPLLPANPSTFEFRKMAFKETNLMFPVDARRVLIAPHDRKMVVHFPFVNRLVGLRDQFDASHVLPIPVCCVVERELGALPGDGVVGVFVGWGKGDVFVYGPGAVDVVLVGADLVGPGPFVEVGGGGEVVEAAVPEEGGVGGGERRQGGEEGSCLHCGWG